MLAKSRSESVVYCEDLVNAKRLYPARGVGVLGLMNFADMTKRPVIIDELLVLPSAERPAYLIERDSSRMQAFMGANRIAHGLSPTKKVYVGSIFFVVLLSSSCYSLETRVLSAVTELNSEAPMRDP